MYLIIAIESRLNRKEMIKKINILHSINRLSLPFGCFQGGFFFLHTLYLLAEYFVILGNLMLITKDKISGASTTGMLSQGHELYK